MVCPLSSGGPLLPKCVHCIPRATKGFPARNESVATFVGTPARAARATLYCVAARRLLLKCFPLCTSCFTEETSHPHTKNQSIIFRFEIYLDRPWGIFQRRDAAAPPRVPGTVCPLSSGGPRLPRVLVCRVADLSISYRGLLQGFSARHESVTIRNLRRVFLLRKTPGKKGVVF